MSEIEKAHLDEESIHGLLDAALPAAEAALAEAHLAACPKCAAEVASVRAVFASLASLPEDPLRIDLKSSVMGRLTAARRLRLAPGLLLAAQVAGSIAALLIARPWLAALLEPIAGFPLMGRISSGLVSFVDEALGAWRSLVTLAADVLSSTVAAVRWNVLPGAVSMPHVVGLLLAAVALCVVGNGVLLKAARAPSGNGEFPR
jgi:anti-sigma factor RsiW